MIGIQDLRYAIRTLQKTPGFTVATVAILAFGIGTNTAIFSLVQSVVLRELPYRDPGRLVWSWSVRSDSRQTPFNIPDFLDYRDRNRTFESISAFADVGANLTGEGEPVRVQGLRISANVFQMLGVAAALGRPLEPDDDRPGAPAVLVVSHALWVRNWGGDPGIVGRKVTMNGTPYTLVGVLPADFLFPKTTAEFAIPLAADSDASRAVRNSTNFLRIFGRLKRGCTNPTSAGRSRGDRATASP
jgi:putative ABC transport system permease protein